MKMKKYTYIIGLIFTSLVLFSCSEFTDCFSGEGAQETRLYDVDFYDKLVLRQNISLEIIQSDEEFVEITTGSRRIDDVKVSVQDSTLTLEAEGLCSAGFSEAPIRAVISTSQLREIRNSSQFAVTSQDVLTYPRLALLSNRDFKSNTINVGDFDLEVDNLSVWVSTTGASIFNLKGKTKKFSFGNYTALGKINAHQLEADTVRADHRGFSDAHVSPKFMMRGEIVSTGNIILHRIPDSINVLETYTGRLMISEEALE